MPQQFYSEEESQEILSIATKRSFGVEGMTRERLIEAAAEMGVRPEDVIAAEEQVLRRRSVETERAEYRAHCRREFYRGISSWLGTSVMLFGINFLTSGFSSVWSTWAIWPVGFFGLSVLKDSIEFLFGGLAFDDEAFYKWQSKRRFTLSQTYPQVDLSEMQKAARQALSEVGPDQKLMAIKLVRERTGSGLKEARDAVVEVWPAP